MSPQTDRWGRPIRDRRWLIERLRWPVIFLVFAGVVAFLIASRRDRTPPKARPIDGYQRDVAVLTREYGRFHGRLLRDPEVEHRFQMAADLVAQNNYGGAIEILEGVARDAAVPVVFNNLGALYAAIDDRARAIAAYREALARDAEYRPVRDSIERLHLFTFDEAAPVRQEIEPNNSEVVANVIALNHPAEGEIAAGDIDTYKFVMPEPPRDVLQIDIENLDRSLEIGARVHDAEMKRESGRLVLAPGESFRRYLSEAPNTAIYLQVWGGRDTAGKYRVSVTPLKSYDAMEPNDDIFSARRIDLGKTYEANIMDSEDTDYYSFESANAGSVAIQVKNESSTLIPALTTFSSDRRNTGFGPDVRKPGESFTYTMEVQEHRTYFLQVWSQSQTSGRYSFTVQPQ
jgi:hypothetical protein